MIFSTTQYGDELERIPEEELAELNILETDDLEEWVIEEPQILGEDLLVITSQYSKFGRV